jgi:hypothetical protein
MILDLFRKDIEFENIQGYHDITADQPSKVVDKMPTNLVIIKLNQLRIKNISTSELICIQLQEQRPSLPLLR